MSNTALEDNIANASLGDKQAIIRVLQAIIDGPLYVPNRHQSHKLSLQPEYPNDLVSILGILDKERTIVPVFSDPKMISEWFGGELLYKTHSGKSLFSILPEGWWLCINPAQEIEKDISPWEISRLKMGLDGIKEILEEAKIDDSVVQSMDTVPVLESEYTELKRKLIEYSSSEGKILSMHMLLEKSLTIDGEALERLLVGVECEDDADLERLKESIYQLCTINLIGDIDVKVLAGSKGNNIILGPFKNNEPFYKSMAKSGLFSKLFKS